MKELELKKMEDLNHCNDKLIDLIVPCYNTKSTLNRLLSSIAMQIMSKNINVILYDDCSTEDYTEIVENFSKIISIQLVRGSKNIGPGGARREGMKAGKCPYVMFMDSDDTFQNAFAVYELYRGITDNDLDAINSIFLEELENHSFIRHEGDWVWVFGKLYKRAFLEEHSIEFNNTRANEDTGFNAVVTSKGKIGYLSDITYIWHFKKDSITRRDGGIYRFTGLEGWFENMIWSCQEMTRIGVERIKYTTKVVSNLLSSYFFYLDLSYDEDERVDLEKFRDWAHNFWVKVVKDVEIKDVDLQEAYKLIGKNNESLIIHIPKKTLYEYIDWIGEGYEKR